MCPLQTDVQNETFASLWLCNATEKSVWKGLIFCRTRLLAQAQVRIFARRPWSEESRTRLENVLVSRRKVYNVASSFGYLNKRVPTLSERFVRFWPKGPL